MQLSTTRVAVVLALLTVTAGCAGLSGSPEATETAAPTTDRQPTTSSNELPIDFDPDGTTSGSGLPQGYDDTGFENSTAATRAHLSALADERYNATYWIGNQSNSGRLSVNGSAGTASLSATVSGHLVDVFVGEETTHQRVISDGNATIEEIDVTQSEVHRAFALPAITSSSYLSNYTLTDTDQTDDGAVHVFEVEGVNRSLEQYPPAEFSNVSGSFRVDDSGRILRYEWEGTYRNESHRYWYQLSERGDTEVIRPEWVDSAASGNATTTETSD